MNVSLRHNLALLNLGQRLQAHCQSLGLTTVLTGGLSLAGYVGELYRAFDDLDLTLIGNMPPQVGVQALQGLVRDLKGEVWHMEPDYFQCRFDNLQSDIVYIQKPDVRTDAITYKTTKTTVTGPEELLEPIAVRLTDIAFLVFRPELAVVEKLVGSLTLNRIRDKDVLDLAKVLDKLEPHFLFQAMRLKFSYVEDRFDNTGF